MNSFQHIFASRLDILDHILDIGAEHFSDDPDAILQFRLVEDMLPFSIQILFTCNQPHGFIRWCEGQEAQNLSLELTTIADAKTLIENTKTHLAAVELKEEKLSEIKRVNLSGDGKRYADLKGSDYVNDYLMPNFYFHLVTAYDILRHKGAPLGKADILRFLAPHVRQA